MSLTLNIRQLGRRAPLEPDWSIPWPPEEDGGGEPLTLRQLITRIVRQEVAAFRQRHERRKLERVLAPAEIEQGLTRGRVESGGRTDRQEVDDDSAVATALQAFEDGLYLVILDGEELRELDQEVFVLSDSQLTFLRLVMLAGG